jgi:glutathione S-transferase
MLAMQLIGMLDSPYVRRVAISLKILGLPFEHESVSVFRHFDRFVTINPVVKAPTLVCDDGGILMDSTLILDYAEALAGPGKGLMPDDIGARQHALILIGLALAACEKSVQIEYERKLRPSEKQHQPWLDRVDGQLRAAYAELEKVARDAKGPLVDEALSQADISVAVAWRFTQYVLPEVITASAHPGLAAFSEMMEARPEFVSTPLE